MSILQLVHPTTPRQLTLDDEAPSVEPSAARNYLAAAGLYLAVRLVGVLILAVFAARREWHLSDVLARWDGQWYLRLAEQGYAVLGNDVQGNAYPDASLAFFPLYPAVIGGVRQLGIPALHAGLVVSAIAGVAASAALFRIGERFGGRRFGGRRAGILLVVLWAGAPLAITQSMVLTESLFTALAAWALVGVIEGRWELAAACTVAAGLTRSTAVVLVAVVAVAGAIAAWRTSGRARWRAAAAAVVAPVGLVAFLGAVAVRTGSVTGWQEIERRGWGLHYDGGATTARFVWDVLTTGRTTYETLTVGIILAAIVLAAVAVQRLTWPLAAYSVGLVVLALGTAGFAGALPRFMLPAFPLLLPVALAVARRRPATIAAVVVGWVLVGSWISGYGLVSKWTI